MASFVKYFSIPQIRELGISCMVQFRKTKLISFTMQKEYIWIDRFRKKENFTGGMKNNGAEFPRVSRLGLEIPSLSV